MKYIKTNLIEFINENRYNLRNEDRYKNYYISDLTRMELIEDFFNKNEKDENYNIELPDYNKLVDDWNGYDDLVYIQNNLKNNEIIFYEGFVDSCWKALYSKPEYKGLNKIEAIEKLITERFKRIAEEFELKIKEYKYFKHNRKYIMEIIFTK